MVTRRLFILRTLTAGAAAALPAGHVARAVVTERQPATARVLSGVLGGELRTPDMPEQALGTEVNRKIEIRQHGDGSATITVYGLGSRGGGSSASVDLPAPAGTELLGAVTGTA